MGLPFLFRSISQMDEEIPRVLLLKVTGSVWQRFASCVRGSACRRACWS